MAGALYERTPVMGPVQISSANTAVDGSGSVTSVVTGTTAGLRVKSVKITPTGSNTRGWIAFFIYDGSNTRLFEIFPIPVSTVVAPGNPIVTYNYIPTQDLILVGTSMVLKAATYIAETFNLHPQAASFA